MSLTFEPEMLSGDAHWPPAQVSTASSPHLPRMVDVDGVLAPQASSNVEETGIGQEVLSDLSLKLGATVPRFTSEWAAEQLRLPLQLVETVLWHLKEDQLLEVLGQTGLLTYRYATTQRGRDYARHLLDVSGYVGPAPVSLESYSAMLHWGTSQQGRITFDDVKEALAGLVLPDDATEVAALAASSGRSLFLFGPPGNGKTTLGQSLHHVLKGALWIPHCISIDSHVIRIFDRQVHHLADDFDETHGRTDRRWLRIRRPLIVSGGEMTMAELDLAYSPSLRFYEAPPHLKANGGTFLLDDFGRQQVDPNDLLNRWIIPLEQRVDHLTLNTGQKIQIPFHLMLIIATNLSRADVADPAFLRRMGYRLHLDKPSEQRYAQIFERYAAAQKLAAEPALIGGLIERYKAEGRELRASEPRDLIERVRDLCRLHGQSFMLSRKMLDTAWAGYFGDASPKSD